ncbi:MAG: tripartite tricarboxylate transporter substrate binding protein [Pseudolabrys sp.]|nr:tripartite tricarboxylate transporter substrate binding protein [Pseudolabrys sp.]
MKILRLLSLAALAATLLVPQAVRAEDYPDRPITVVIPLGAGGSHDLHARGITPILSKILGQPVIVSLVPGGAGMKGTTEVANAKPDGYTIIFTHNAFDQLTPQTRKVSFDLNTAFKSVARINTAEPLLAARTGVPYKTIPELVAYAKKNPGKVNIGHTGVWGVGFVPTMQFIKAAGIKVNLIPHTGGGPAMRAVLAGEDDMTFGFVTQYRPHYKAGKLIMLGLAGDEPLKDDPDFKDVKTMKDFGYPTVDFTMDRIFMAPAGIPADRLAILRKAFDTLSKTPEFTTFLHSIGEKANYMGGADYDVYRAKRIKQLADLIKEVGSK